MQSHVDNMEQQMSKVNDDMKKISGLSDKINGTLSSRRTKIDQLSTMHRLLKKVPFLTLLFSPISFNSLSNCHQDLTAVSNSKLMDKQ